MNPHTKIINYMTPFPYSVTPEDELSFAQSLMNEHRMRHLPVRNHSGELVGVISERDIQLMSAMIVRDGAVDEVSGVGVLVSTAMIPQPYTVDVDTDIRLVCEQMVVRQIGSALVTRHGQLAGIFTMTDACKGLRAVLDQVLGDYSLEPDVA